MQDALGNVLISVESLTGFCSAVLTKLGAPLEQATAIAGNLVAADLQGVASHGVVRLPIYV
jgi:ureidoglycolate dehydrogenase (NAD+)